MLDFGAYLRRIGLNPADEPTWQAVHRAQATTIPFENLGSHRGIPVSLEQSDLERKLVASRRGGDWFEHNLSPAGGARARGPGGGADAGARPRGRRSPRDAAGRASGAPGDRRGRTPVARR